MTTIRCKCHELGVVFGKYDSMRITRLLIEPIRLTWHVSLSSEESGLIVVWVTLTSAVLLYVFGIIRDLLKKRQVSLIRCKYVY